MKIDRYGRTKYTWSMPSNFLLCSRGASVAICCNKVLSVVLLDLPRSKILNIDNDPVRYLLVIQDRVLELLCCANSLARSRINGSNMFCVSQKRSTGETIATCSGSLSCRAMIVLPPTNLSVINMPASRSKLAKQAKRLSRFYVCRKKSNHSCHFYHQSTGINCFLEGVDNAVWGSPRRR